MSSRPCRSAGFSAQLQPCQAAKPQLSVPTNSQGQIVAQVGSLCQADPGVGKAEGSTSCPRTLSAERGNCHRLARCSAPTASSTAGKAPHCHRLAPAADHLRSPLHCFTRTPRELADPPYQVADRRDVAINAGGGPLAFRPQAVPMNLPLSASAGTGGLVIGSPGRRLPPCLSGQPSTRHPHLKYAEPSMETVIAPRTRGSGKAYSV